MSIENDGVPILEHDYGGGSSSNRGGGLSTTSGAFLSSNDGKTLFPTNSEALDALCASIRDQLHVRPFQIFGSYPAVSKYHHHSRAASCLSLNASSCKSILHHDITCVYPFFSCTPAVFSSAGAHGEHASAVDGQPPHRSGQNRARTRVGTVPTA